MKKRIELVIPGACVPKERPRVTWQGGRAFAYTPERSRTYTELARAVAISAYNEFKFKKIPYPEPVKLTLTFTLNRVPTSSPDLINMAAQICDVLQGKKEKKKGFGDSTEQQWSLRPIAYDDDSQITELHLYQVKGRFPMTEVIVESA